MLSEEDEEEEWLDCNWDMKYCRENEGQKQLAPVSATKSTMGITESETESTKQCKSPSINLPSNISSDKPIVSRMELNDNKAGMEGLDREKINQIIYEASKGSKFYENELKKEEQVNQRISEQQRRLERLSAQDLEMGCQEADALLYNLETKRDLSHSIVHIDMDAFYAAVEMRDKPSLRSKPMAVGGNSMLSTSNYIARRYGVRAAMPGFIGRKLCPDLIIVPSNFDKYTAVSKQIRAIMSQYDPAFCPMSLDETYLDFTEHLKKRENMSEDDRTFELNVGECVCRTDSDDRNESESIEQSCATEQTEIMEQSSTVEKVERDPSINDSENGDVKNINRDNNSNKTMATENDKIIQDNLAGFNGKIEVPSCTESSGDLLCSRCGLSIKFVTKKFGTDVEDAVNEMRARIHHKTRLTASAGIAPNTMLAKICSDKNKPNGQYRIQPTYDSVMEFIKDLPIRKISGVGKVTEKMLSALGIVTCTDLFNHRGKLYHLYSQTSFHYFMRICLGIGSTRVERDGDRKSMSVERTFCEINTPAELQRKCYELSEALSDDLREENLKGKTITLKLKTVKFEIKTRANSIADYSDDKDVIYKAALEVLRAEIQACAPEPLRLRLMGVRMSNFQTPSSKTDQKQSTITGFIQKLQSKAHGQGADHMSLIAQNDSHLSDKRESRSDNDMVNFSIENSSAAAHNSETQTQSDLSHTLPVEELDMAGSCIDTYVCPVCDKPQTGLSLEDFNCHVDACLSKGAIREILHEQRSEETGKKRPSRKPEVDPPHKKRKVQSKNTVKTIDRFFRTNN